MPIITIIFVVLRLKLIYLLFPSTLVGYAEFKEELVKTITMYGTYRMAAELYNFSIQTPFVIINNLTYLEENKAIILVNLLMVLVKNRTEYERIKEYLRNQKDLWPMCVRLEQIG